MTKRPRKAKVRGKPPAKVRKPDPLDDFIVVGARALDLKIEKPWMPAVRANLAVTLRLAAQVTDFTLPDDAEAGPVFKA